MNREIKFRAWDVNKKKMIFGPTDDNPNASWILAWEGMLPIMQSTGLKDSNGVEIFEGDLVQDYEEVQQVVWDDVKAGFVLRGGRDPILSHPHELLVIGNIYEYPELLKG